MERIARGVAHRVLHEERHTPKRSVGQVRGRGLGARPIEAFVDHRVERGVQRLDPRDRGVDELERRCLAARDEIGLGGGVEPREVVGHRPSSSTASGPSDTPDKLPDMDEVSPRKSRSLAAALEPVIGQVFFAPECHAAYAALGFAPSPGQAGLVHLPDGPAYFTSRGSLLGQVRPGVVAAAFGVFKPEIVSAGVTLGWSLTDASTIFEARREGAVAQLERVVGPAGNEVERAAELLERAVAPLAVAGRPLFAGLRSWWDDPTDPWTRLFHLGDMLRECRGDAHVAAWSSAALDGLEIGLLNDIYMGLPLRSYVRTRGWSEEDLAGGVERLRDIGWLDGDEFTDEGRAVREDIENATDLQMMPALEALAGDVDEVVELLKPWGVAMREAGGYVGGPVDLWPVRDD